MTDATLDAATSPDVERPDPVPNYNYQLNNHTEAF